MCCRHGGGRAELLPPLRGPQGSGHLHPDPAETLQRVTRDLHRAAAERGGAGGEVQESTVSGAQNRRPLRLEKAIKIIESNR